MWAATRGLAAWAALTAAAIATAATAADTDWRTYNGGLDGQRFADVAQIDRLNIGMLRALCEARLGDDGPFQSGILLVEGKLIVTTAHTTVALDPADCSLRWRHVYQPEEEEVWIVNRGAAYAEGRVFRGTADGRVLALDAANGALLWQVKAGDPKAREYFAAAPLVWQGRLYLGVAGSDWGIRGRVMAFDTRDGRELWRFNTIPMGRETGARSWRNPASARTGGGGTWSSYALDPATGELFVSVANPAPDFLPSRRPGDNLFTNSLVVLDARDGRLEWWHQVGRNDSHDWDLAAAPMLYSTRDGQARVALGSKDGHVYAVDRRTRRRVFQTAVTRIENSAAVPTPQGVHVCPGGQAGVHWNGPAFDAARAQLLVGSVDACGTFKSDPAAKRTLGMGYNGGAFTADPQAPLGRVTALDAATGTTRWRFDSPVPIVAGVTPTAGGLVFTGDLAGDLIALNSDDGRLLGRWASGGAIAGGVISYRVGAAQYVATTSGNISRLSFKSTGSPKIVVFALGDGSPAAAPRVVEVAPAPAGGRADGPVDINWGKLLYASHCAACHGARGEGGGAAPALTGLAQRRSYADTVAFIKDPKAPMPRQFPAPLSAEEVDDIATFIRAF